MLHMAALVYDIGKVGIPVDVLNRRGDLSEQDKLAIRSHPEVGKRLLESATRLSALAPIVLHHHERWDGAGYPDGLRGEQIPFEARVIAVCDAWQAMVSDRPLPARLDARRRPSRSCAPGPGGSSTRRSSRSSSPGCRGRPGRPAEAVARFSVGHVAVQPAQG